MRCVCGWVCLAALLLSAVSRGEAQTALPVLAAAPKQLKIDGDLGDWRGARFTRLGADPAGSAELALAYETSGLYVAARVSDDAFVRSVRPSAREDALVLRLVFPRGAALVEQELFLFAGRIGETAASVQLKAAGASAPLRPVRNGAQIVEGPSPRGYAVEAFVPWSSFEGGADWAFARGAAQLNDVDPGAKPHGPSSAPPQLTASKIPWLAFDGGAGAALAAFLRQKNLAATTPRLDLVTDLRGDARAERVLVIGTFVVVSGAGSEFQYSELPVRASSELQRAELLDLTGDGRPELLLRIRQPTELGTRELLRVLDLSAAAPRPTFGVETRKETAAGFVEARVRFEPAARAPLRIVVSASSARGLSADNYVEAPASDLIPIPLPWGSWLERVYGWDGTRFALQHEKANPRAQALTTVAPRTATSTSTSAPLGAAPAPSAGESPLLAYKRARGLAPDAAPRFAQSANLLGDTRPELLGVFGRELVVSGEGLAGDVGFVYLGLPVADPADVLGLTSGDVTGDGRRELFARLRQRIGDVQRELLYCYTWASQSPERLLTVEVARARGAQRIDNKWSLVPDKQRTVLTIEPGEARGWSANDYPFVAESLDGIAPLLLPWKDRTLRYVFARGQLVPE